MINIAVNTRLAVVGEKERITTGSAGIEVQFTFSEDWDGLSKVALFRNGDEAETQVDMALDETGLTTLPPEICSEDYIDEAVMVGVYGTDGLGTVIIPTVWVSIGALREGAISQGSTAAPPTPDMWAQLQLLALNTGAENAEAAAASAEEAGEAEAAAKTAAGHYPQIVEGYWHVWDAEAGEYVNTEVKAEGVDGQDGQDGEGVPAGGTTGQFLQKASDDDHDTRWTTLGEATTAAAGLMSNTDKTKLDGVEAGAQANTVDSVNGKTGAVVLNAGDLAYDDTETYGSGTVGGNLSELTRHLSDKQDKAIYQTVTGTTLTLNPAVDNTMYLCGELTELTVTAPATGIFAVRFTSGTTPTVVTFTGITMPDDWPTTLDASTTYEINVLNGFGVWQSWI